MASHTFLQVAVAICALCSTFWVSLGQTIAPTNMSAMPGAPAFDLETPQSALSKMGYEIDPLTTVAGIGASGNTAALSVRRICPDTLVNLRLTDCSK